MIACNALPKAISRTEMVNETSKDATLIEVKKLIDNKQYKAELVGQYRQLKDELSTTNDGLVLRGDRICIPEALQN